MKSINVNLFGNLSFYLCIFSMCLFVQVGHSQYGNKIYLEQGNMNSFGTYDGVYFKGSTTAGYDCECWTRPATDPLGQLYQTIGTKNQAVSIGKPSGGNQWYVFKHPNCPNLTSSPLPAFGPITTVSGCSPANMFKTHETMTRMVIPFFVDPTVPANHAAWDELEGYATTMGEHLVVIANPNSGPSATKNTTYATRIKNLQDNGAKVIGYIALTHGSKTRSAISTELGKWYMWYKIDGIFFDEASPPTGSTNTAFYDEYDIHYADVQSSAITAGLRQSGDKDHMVIFNPGVIPNPAWNSAWDGHSGLICTFENEESAFAGVETNLSNLPLDQKERSVILIHDLSLNDWEDRFDWLLNQGFNNFYFTNEVLGGGNFPWNHKSPYISNQVNKAVTTP